MKNDIMIHCFIFDLLSTEDNFNKPEDFEFRGAILKLLRKISETLGNSMHEKPTDIPNQIRNYSIRHKPIKIYNHTKSNDQHQQEPESYNGFRFYFNVFNNYITEKLVDYLLNIKLDSINLGGFEYKINNITVETKNPLIFLDDNNITTKFKLIFHSPTAFNRLDSKTQIKFPDPERFLINLIKIWNLLYGGTEYECQKDILGWIKKNFSLNEANIKVRSYSMGITKPKFTGFIGSAIFSIWNNQLEKTKMANALIRLGEIMGVGRGRSFGFGNYQIINTN